jgi:hypothetical protein
MLRSIRQHHHASFPSTSTADRCACRIWPASSAAAARSADRVELELSRVLDAPGVTHLRYRVAS